ncbi:MAG: DNA repair protein RadC [Rikenellaceae bacterium]|nr:DNA repair protein RadC [Rikenellaceae bacterium]MCL2693108.1 DNA repair protein RadC [Rikenellaceae bacterium]
MAASDDRAIRERLVHQGVGSLSDAELIAVLIQDGGAGISAAELAQNVLDKHGGSLSQLPVTDIKALRMTAGLGLKRAAILAAAFELGRRLALEDAVTPCVITSNTDVEKIFRPQIAALPYEEFWVLYLSSANTVVGKECVSRGGISETVVDHRLVLKRAIETLASGMILVHNHPSGIAQPSDDDLILTRKIVDAAELLDISVLDHLIITSGDCYSFRGGGDL